MTTLRNITARLNASATAILSATALLSASALLTTSCSMMKEDRSDCPTCYNTMHLHLAYDITMDGGHTLAGNVGAATAYLVDPQSGLIVARQSVTAAPDGPDPFADPLFQFNFSELDPGDYQAYVVACDRDFTQAYAADGARLRADFNLATGNNISALRIRLDRDDAATPVDGTPRHAVAHRGHDLDSIYYGRTSVFTVPANVETDQTVHLMRDNKTLHVVVHNLDHVPTPHAAADYAVRIIDANGLLDFTNAPLPDDALLYTPFAAWTTTGETRAANANAYADGTRAVAAATDGTRAAAADVETWLHYQLSTSRLIRHAAAGDDARLQILDANDGTLLVDVNLPYYLAMARNFYATRYDEQDYLDRENQYQLDFFLEGDTWRYLYVGVNVLSWTVRIQNETL